MEIERSEHMLEILATVIQAYMEIARSVHMLEILATEISSIHGDIEI